MKRLIAAAIGLCLAGAVFAAQGSFTIVRPADGSKVREKVRILIPKNSLDEDGSYLGIFLGGKFLEATVPPVEGNYRVYTLDTKGRNIADGELKLELVKYVTYQDQPRIVDRSSVTVTVGNHMNIGVPASGFKLRYGFTPGRQLTYRVDESVSVSTITGLDNSLGGRPAELPASDLSSRIMYAVDNKYGDGSALLRIQELPARGKDYALLLLPGETAPKPVDQSNLVPIYLKVNSMGRPDYAALPPYFGFEGTGGGGNGDTDVYSVAPLPVLPEKFVKPGSSWPAAYLVPIEIDPAKAHEATKVTQTFPARGEFLAVEWEMGHPCAKIRNSIAQGTRSLEGIQLEKAGRAFGDDKVALDETIWFALDSKVILKRVRTIQIDQKVKADGGAAGGAGNGTNGGPGNGKFGAASGPAGIGGGGGDDRQMTGNFQGGKFGPQRGGGGGTMGPQRPGNQQGGNQGRSGGSGGSRVQYIRQRFQQTFILEQ